MKAMQRIESHMKRQSGSVLIFSLILMMVMTILAVSGVGNSVLEQHMSGNYYDSNTAFQSSEKALRVAEAWISNNVKGNPGWRKWFEETAANNGKQGLYSTRTVVADSKVCKNDNNCFFIPTSEADWDKATVLPKGFVTLGTNDLGGAGNLAAVQSGVEKQPRFIVEYIGPVSKPKIMMNDPTPDILREAFRVTAIGWGKKSTTRHVLQSHVLLPL